MITKKIIVGVVLLISLLIVGCVDYKTYDTQPETNLIDEIAAIEEELGLTKEVPTDEDEIEDIIEELDEETTTEEEIILPDLGEETEEVVVEEGLMTITAKENEEVKLNLKVSDPDEDKVSYTFSPPLNEKGEWQTNYGDAGEYIVTITATDGVHTTEKRVKLVIEKKNVPPIIENIRDIVAKEGDLVSFEPIASDPNNDQVTVIVSEPLSDGSFQTDHTSAGEYQIKVTASDGDLETEKTFKLTITDANVLPKISGLEDITIKEGETARIEPIVTDLDEDDVRVTISEPVGNDGVWETSFTDHGTYDIKVTVTDGKDTVIETVKLIVEDVNKAPEITDIFLG